MAAGEAKTVVVVATGAVAAVATTATGAATAAFAVVLVEQRQGWIRHQSTNKWHR